MILSKNQQTIHFYFQKIKSNDIIQPSIPTSAANLLEINFTVPKIERPVG